MGDTIKKILIANRGEIAVRVIRTARELGISTVAIYSDFDTFSPHVKMADESVHLGPAAASQSYLNMDKIIQAAQDTAADAIHPGYGFLSENAEFARKVSEAGIIFIGPGPESIRLMGDKLTSKATVKDYGVPLIPGLQSAIEDVNEAKKFADQIGYPVLIKASAGGGGKGMRIVEKSENLAESMKSAMSEARSAFGNGSVFIEKYLVEPKHIEFQVLRDSHGNCVHVFERECSIQRRYQKVVEEAPSKTLDEDLRNRMGEAAIHVAESCDYLGAGTVEFIVDKNRDFYFLEMNTRLQVEHPVTEMITGLDLVKEQIRIAEGKELSVKQEDLQIEGHAVELRVYAENPFDNFLPDIGTLTKYRAPGGPGVRVDDGYEEGAEIPIYYDPMIAKLATHGQDRDTAIDRLIRAIDEYRIAGVHTSLPFGRFVLEHPEFRDGTFTTSFVDKYWNPENFDHYIDQEEAIAAILAAHFRNEKVTHPNGNGVAYGTVTSNWKRNRIKR